MPSAFIDWAGARFYEAEPEPLEIEAEKDGEIEVCEAKKDLMPWYLHHFTSFYSMYYLCDRMYYLCEVIGMPWHGMPFVCPCCRYLELTIHKPGRPLIFSVCHNVVSPWATWACCRTDSAESVRNSYQDLWKWQVSTFLLYTKATHIHTSFSATPCNSGISYLVLC